MKRSSWTAVVLGEVARVGAGAAVLVGIAAGARAQVHLWGQQFGSSGDDSASAVAEDGSGGLLLAGPTQGTIPGAVGAGNLFLARMDGSGSPLWVRQFCSLLSTPVTTVAADGSGGAFVAGWTTGDMGGPNAGGMDVWIARHDAGGNPMWIRQFGTRVTDAPGKAIPDGGGGVFLSGFTAGSLAGPHVGSYDVWLARYDGAGNQVWVRQLGSTGSDTGDAVAPDGAGGVYVVGSTTGVLAPPGVGFADPFVARYDSAGDLLWVRQTGTVWSDMASVAAPDGAGGVYLGGWTTGDFGGPLVGKWDAWVARFDGAGNQLWVRQIGSPEFEELHAAALDVAGGVFVGGLTEGALYGPSSGEDGWVARLDSLGNLVWGEQIASYGDERTTGLASLSTGGAVACGYTDGPLFPPKIGWRDAWVVRYAGDCVAPTTYCTSKASSIPGCVPGMGFDGVACASAGSGFEVSVAPLPGKKMGMWVYTTRGAAAAPVVNAYGWLCIETQGMFRCSPGVSDGTSGVCDGTLAFDFNAYFMAQVKDPALVAGATVDLQAWYRDPPSVGGANLTEAGRFVVCP